MFRDRRILIFAGGDLGPWALEEVRAGDFIIGVDRGALFLLQNKIVVDYALGDFDSVTPEEFAAIREWCTEAVSCDPVAKDYTDSEMAVNWALARKPSEIVILGALGSRMDHSLANIHLLSRCLQEGIACRIVGEKNEISLVDKYTSVFSGLYTYVSILPLTFEVTGVTLEGFQYPLNRATLHLGQSIGISNNITEEVGKISVESGQLLVIKSKD